MKNRYVNLVVSLVEEYCRLYSNRGFSFDFDGKIVEIGNKNERPRIWFKDSNSTWKRILSGGSIPLGETYVEGKWGGESYKETPFLLEFMLRLAYDKRIRRNISLFDKIMISIAVIRSTTGSLGTTRKENINTHYSLEKVLDDADASNSFFSPIIGEEFPVYSCAYWENGARSLEEGQLAKFKLYAKELKLEKGKGLLDLGCGWGTQSLWYAKHLGVYVTLVTLSNAQAKHISDEIKKENLEDYAQVKLMDMMEIDKLDERYDAIISLGAIEHIDNFDVLFKKSSKILKKNGKALFHTMFNHVHYDFDTWLSKYMWPGVQIPSRERLLANLSKNFENITFISYRKGSYSKTFRHWSENFANNRRELKNILRSASFKGDVEKFMKQFEYYLACCCIVYNVYMDVGYALCDNEVVSRED